MPFKQIKVSPVLTNFTAMDAGDVVFNNAEIELPYSGTCAVRGITVVNHANLNPADAELEMIFLNDNGTDIGTVDATASVKFAPIAESFLGYYRQSLSADNTSSSGDFDEFTISGINSTKATFTSQYPLFLTPKSGERNVYFSAITPDTPTFDGATGVIVNGAVTLGASDTLAVDGQPAGLHFKVGDTVCDSSANVVGVIKSVSTNSIVFEAVTTHAVANDEELFLANQLLFIFNVEYDI
tara:strand:+ start:19 stop:738 length:720 start_codon:yes stop_codon:yes gene_type:complete